MPLVNEVTNQFYPRNRCSLGKTTTENVRSRDIGSTSKSYFRVYCRGWYKITLMNTKSATTKTIIFDLGRVLVHYSHSATLEGLAAVSSLSADDLGRLTDGSFGDRLGRGEMGAKDLHRFMMNEANTVDDFQAFIKGYTAGISRNEEALAYALSLTERTGVQVGIISNTNEAHAIWLHASLPELKRFANVILSNEVGLIKPDARIYQHALNALQVDPADTLFIDDLAENIEGAKAMGMAGIVHTDWAITRPQIEEWLANA